MSLRQVLVVQMNLLATYPRKKKVKKIRTVTFVLNLVKKGKKAVNFHVDIALIATASQLGLKIIKHVPYVVYSYNKTPLLKIMLSSSNNRIEFK